MVLYEDTHTHPSPGHTIRAFGNKQAPLYPIPTPLTTGATADACYDTCSLEPFSVPFYFAVIGGACVCSRSETVIYNPEATVRPRWRQTGYERKERYTTS